MWCCHGDNIRTMNTELQGQSWGEGLVSYKPGLLSRGLPCVSDRAIPHTSASQGPHGRRQTHSPQDEGHRTSAGRSDSSCLTCPVFDHISLWFRHYFWTLWKPQPLSCVNHYCSSLPLHSSCVSSAKAVAENNKYASRIRILSVLKSTEIAFFFKNWPQPPGSLRPKISSLRSA